MSVVKEPFCSFCFHTNTEAEMLIAGGSDENPTFICDECIITSRQEIAKAIAEKKKTEAKSAIPTPRAIKSHLDSYIIGQDDAKEAVAVSVYNHYKRLAAKDARPEKGADLDEVEIDKSNILLIGPTGSGKTLFARTIAKLIDVPFTIADATSLTEAGYVGEDVESIITRLLQAANYDVKRAERGIVYLDEIDKKAKRGDASSNAKDVSGEGVQQALLKLLEGNEVFVASGGGRRGPSSEMVKIDTSNILFICGGAFVGIEDTIKRSQKKGSSIGFAGTPTGSKIETSRELMAKIEPEHLASFGVIPELVGRLPVIAVLDELDEMQLVRVLTEPRNAITRQFASLFGMDRIDLEFADDALHEMARLSIAKKTGARGLRGVLERKLMKLQFELPELRDSGVTRIVITKDMITSGSSPEVFYSQI